MARRHLAPHSDDEFANGTTDLVRTREHQHLPAARTDKGIHATIVDLRVGLTNLYKRVRPGVNRQMSGGTIVADLRAFRARAGSYLIQCPHRGEQWNKARKQMATQGT